MCVATVYTFFSPEQKLMVDSGSVAAVIVVLVLAMATGCIITCAVVVWKRTSARKNIKLK